MIVHAFFLLNNALLLTMVYKYTCFVHSVGEFQALSVKRTHTSKKNGQTR